MNRRSILTKTGKGLMEATGKTSNLSRDLRNILKEIDGKVSVSELSEKFSKMTEQKLLESLSTMERDGYVREFVGKQEDKPRVPTASGPGSQSFGDGSDLDFTAFTPAKPNAKANEEARLQAQAQEIARQAQATRAREETAAKARADMTAPTKAEADQRVRQAAAPRPAPSKPSGASALPPLINPSVVPPVIPPAAGILGAGPEAAARAQADALARSQAADLDRARREAEDTARRDAEERGRREAEEKTRRDAEERAKREAEERKLREIAERTRREEEEKTRREAEARARREVEERGKREAEERLRREMEERARREIEERIKREEADRRRREEEDRARREAEERERRRREEEERARREVERQARVDAEAKARVEAELRGKRESEERARREEDERRQEHSRKRVDEEDRKRGEKEAAEALERSVREEQEKAAREAEDGAEREETERRESEEREAAEAEQAEQHKEEEEERAQEEEKRARREEKEQARAAAKARKAERARERAGVEAWRGDEDALRDSSGPSLSAAEMWEKRKPANIAKAFAVLLLFVLVVGVAVLPFVPLETAPYEKSAQAWLDQPVKIGSVSLTLLPLPQLKFEKVAIGRDPQMKVAVIRASPELTTLLEDRIQMRSLELQNVTLPKEFLSVLLQGKPGRRGLGAQHIVAKGLKFDAQDLGLPPLDMNATLSSGGALMSASFTNAEQGLSITVEPRGGKADVDISSSTLPLPVGVDIGLTDFSGKGTATATELVIPKAEARAYGGRIFGNLRLRWSSGWSLEGELSARQMEAAKIAGPLIGTGTVIGKARLSMRGLLPERMILNSQLEGNFSIQKGSISNVDMTRLLQGSGSAGGTTFFAELDGDFSADPNRLLVRNLKLSAGLMSGVGQLDMDPQRNLSGRMQLELRAQSVQARSTLGVSGTLTNPQFRRTN
jgi:hypothetical protein